MTEVELLGTGDTEGEGTDAREDTAILSRSAKPLGPDS